MSDNYTLTRLEKAVRAFREAEEWRVSLERGFGVEEIKVRVGGVVEDVALTGTLVDAIRATLLAGANEESARLQGEMRAIITELDEGRQ